MEQFLTPDEAAAALRVNVRTIYKWLKEGRLSAGRAGGRWLITEQNIIEFLAAPRRSRLALDAGTSLAGTSPPLSPVPGLGADPGVSGPTGAVAAGAPPGGNPLANKKQKPRLR